MSDLDAAIERGIERGLAPLKTEFERLRADNASIRAALAAAEKRAAVLDASEREAWAANTRLNATVERLASALEQIIAEGPPAQYERIARRALAPTPEPGNAH